jgi:glycosyltransferase involved in cell wall biosynthesis
MRILLATDYATPTGGAELMVLALRDLLRRRGHDARLFASSARPMGAPGQADYECFGIASELRGFIQVANPSAYLSLNRVLRDFRPEVVHVRLLLGQLSPLILPLLENVPAIFHVAWYRSICPIGTKMLPDFTSCRETAGLACLRNRCLPLYAWPFLMTQLKLWRRWCGAFNLVVANSHATKRRLEAEGMRTSEVIWNGVPVTAARRPLNYPPTIAFAGRLVPEKGADVLIEAFARVAAQMPKARLLIAGDGPERPRIVSKIEQLGLSGAVTLLGHLSRQRLEEHFAEAWVQVVPSRWEEPFGIVAAEAMMRGTAVIASNTGGLAELIRDGETGVLIPPSDPVGLSDALLSLLGDPERADRIGASGREFAMRYLTEDGFADHFVRLYESLCARPAAPAIAESLL